jgi:hypothetical protein
MTESEDIYFKGTEGMRRLRDQMEYLACFREGIDRVQLFNDKRMRYLDASDRVKLADYLINLDEIYWRQFHTFIDRVHAYKKFMA